MSRYRMVTANGEFDRGNWAACVQNAIEATQGFIQGTVGIVAEVRASVGREFDYYIPERYPRLRECIAFESHRGAVRTVPTETDAIQAIQRMRAAWDVTVDLVKSLDSPPIAWARTSAKRLPAVGRCMYCPQETRSDNVAALSDGHVVPLSLGGTLILPKASCEECAKITSQFERHVARHTFASLRYHCRLPSRREKDFPKTLPIRLLFDPGQPEREAQIPVADFPVIVNQLIWEPPKLLSGTDKQGANKFAIVHLRSQHDTDARFQLIRHLHRARKAGVRNSDVGTMPLLRMVAKIAHGYLVAEIGIDSFKSVLLDIIKGTNLSQVGRFVGCGEKNESE